MPFRSRGGCLCGSDDSGRTLEPYRPDCPVHGKGDPLEARRLEIVGSVWRNVTNATDATYGHRVIELALIEYAEFTRKQEAEE